MNPGAGGGGDQVPELTLRLDDLQVFSAALPQERRQEFWHWLLRSQLAGVADLADLKRAEQGLTALRTLADWPGLDATAQRLLAEELTLTTGALHRQLVLEQAGGDDRAPWLWLAWEAMRWREDLDSPAVAWWPPVREQLVRFGALAWAAEADRPQAPGVDRPQAITRALTLLAALSPLHVPLPLWIPQLSEHLLELGLETLEADPPLAHDALATIRLWLGLHLQQPLGGEAVGEQGGEAGRETDLFSAGERDGDGASRLEGEALAALMRALEQADLAGCASRLERLARRQQAGRGFLPNPLAPEAGASGPPVSLTAISGRLDLLPAVLESLRRQTLRPARVHLHLSEAPHLLDEGIAPDHPRLRALADDPWIQIHWVDNLGPYRKIAPYLASHPAGTPGLNGGDGHERGDGDEDDRFITIDDDTIYPPRFVEYLVRQHERHGCIVAHRGRRMRLADEAGFLPYAQWHDGLHAPRLANLPTGQSGVLYRRRYFPRDLELEAAMALAPTHDDLWLRLLTARQGIPAVILQPNAAARTEELAFPRASERPAQQEPSLWFAYNVAPCGDGGFGGNDRAGEAISAYFQARGFDLLTALRQEQEELADFY